jgi:Flp pilus assembly protein CpaB
MAQKKMPILAASTVGLIVGVLLGAVLGRATASGGVTRCPVSMETVVVAVQDLPAGTVLTEELLAQRDMPSAFFTSSIVPVEMWARVIGQKLLVDLQRGDALLWSQMAPAPVDPPPGGGDSAAEVARPIE